MKQYLSLFGAVVLAPYVLISPDANAQTTAIERAQAFVCNASGHCMLPYKHPEVQKAFIDLAEIEADCRSTTTGLNSIPDRFGFARAKLDVYQDLNILMLDFKPIVRKHCSSISLDSMLNAYVSERNRGASHSTAVATLLISPNSLTKTTKAK